MQEVVTGLDLIVSPDESRGCHAFVIVMPLLPLPLHRFLVCALHPTVLIQSFSNSRHTCLVLRSRCQLISHALRFHLWPPGGQKGFPCGHRPEFSTDFLHIHTKYVLDQGLDVNQFSVPCRSICGHQEGLICFLCTL